MMHLPVRFVLWRVISKLFACSAMHMRMLRNELQSAGAEAKQAHEGSSLQRHTLSGILKICDINGYCKTVCMLCSNLQPAGAEAKQAQQGSYLQRHTSSIVLKIAQEASTPPLPAVATMVCTIKHTYKSVCFAFLSSSREQSRLRPGTRLLLALLHN